MNVSIIIPTFNRKSFSQLISLNIKNQTYPFIKQVIVADDGDDKERLDLDVNCSVLYFKVERMSIGEKRNFLISKCDTEYIACLDTDDFYNPNYLSTSIFNLIKNNKQVSGSSDMMLIEAHTPDVVYKTNCLYIHMLNEATLVFTKQYANTHKFKSGNSGEGIGFLSDGIPDIIQTDIEDIMICVAHKNNTITKTNWVNNKYLCVMDMTIYQEQIKLISLLNI